MNTNLILLYLKKLKILKNFQDIDFSSLKLRRDFEINSLNYLIDSGYVNIDTPVIESADLFFRKSLGSTSGNTYTFTDLQNQQVSLRPDFTASIMRYAFSNLKKIKNNPDLILQPEWSKSEKINSSK